jgi:RNA polymerase sigma-54 factor
MELKQKLELRKLLAPEMRQSLKILALPLLDLKNMVDAELLDNPLLEEYQPETSLEKTQSQENLEKLLSSLPPVEEDYEKPLDSNPVEEKGAKHDLSLGLLTKKVSLLDILVRQLGMFSETDEELRIGQEIIGNIDENGYLKAPLEQICQTLNVPLDQAEKVLALIQQFEPAGVGCRDIQECLLIQLKLTNSLDPILEKIIKLHLDDVAKKNYSKIAKELKEPQETIDLLIKKIAKLNPKPGRDYSTDAIQQIIPDVVIEEVEDKLVIHINNENIPHLMINKSYREMIKKGNLDQQTREFLTNKLQRAYEMLRAVSKRQSTLRMVMETIVNIQEQAIREDLSLLKPLNFAQVADKIKMHETTVCRVVMNKYAQTPRGTIALKDFFPSKLRQNDTQGESVSSQQIKSLIQELIDEEDKKHPLSDENIVKLVLERYSLNVARRTIAKYREELKILSSTYRKER